MMSALYVLLGVDSSIVVCDVYDIYLGIILKPLFMLSGGVNRVVSWMGRARIKNGMGIIHRVQEIMSDWQYGCRVM